MTFGERLSGIATWKLLEAVLSNAQQELVGRQLACGKASRQAGRPRASQGHSERGELAEAGKAVSAHQQDGSK